MKLHETSLEWALSHICTYSDTDLFPKPIEFDVLKNISQDVINKLKDVDLSNYVYGPPRRFIVPKDDISYRTATQLDPLDSIFLSAIIYQFGQNIENRRIPIKEERIFGYRFHPQSDWSLYDPNVSWSDFWMKCLSKSHNYKYAVYIDIADFYNQIYHHSIENELIESKFPNQVKKWIMGLLEHVTVKMSRGIPVGSHATHLLGEMSLISVDNSLLVRGIDFCRYVDDIVVFCNTYEQAKIIIYQLAEILDRQQRLIMQRQKTKIFTKEEFIVHCNDMFQDRPINKQEEDIINVIRKNKARNPYISINIDNLSLKERSLFKKHNIELILSSYLQEPEPNYTRLRWFIRRLSQIGTPTAVSFCIRRIKHMTPAIGEICTYLVSVSNRYEGNWANIGDLIFKLLESDLIKSNEYFQVALLSLFSRNSKLNHTDKLILLYRTASPSLRREILLCARTLSMGDWIKELKEDYSIMDLWSKRAFIIASKTLRMEERKFFLNHSKDGNILNELLMQWAKQE
jgi:hypothetical protein